MSNFHPDTIPTREGEVIIELRDEHVDSFSRRMFFAHWLGWGPRAVGFDYGHRAQVFYTRVDEFTRRHTERDETVRVVGPFPQSAPQPTRRSS